MKYLLSRAAALGLSLVMIGSLVIPYTASAANKHGNIHEGIHGGVNIMPTLKNIKNRIVKLDKKTEDGMAAGVQNTFNTAVHNAQMTLNQALRQADQNYNAANKAARNTLHTQLEAAGNNAAARAAALAAYRAALFAALKVDVAAKAAAYQQFATTIQGISLPTQSPVANNQNVSVNENSSVGITLTGSDPQSLPLTYSVVTNHAHGLLSGAAPALTYTPTGGYTGSDSFTFKVNDGTLNSAAATVSITVNAASGAPTANAQSITVVEDTATGLTLTGSDPASLPLTYSVVTNPASGILSGTAPALTYTPNANFNGSDSFTFKVNNGTTDSVAATISISVTAVNDAPVASAQSVTTTTNVAKAITLSGSDVDGCSAGTYTYSVTTQPTNGAVAPATGAAVCSSGTLTASVTYTPNSGFNGSDSFVFKLNDGTADSATATVSVTVNP